MSSFLRNLTLVGLLAAIVVGDHGPVAVGSQATAVDVTLTELRERPDQWLGERVTTIVQLAEIGGDWMPWTSRFGPDDFVRVEAWGDEQLPWYRAEYDDPARFLFVRRDSTVEFMLEHSNPHDRFLAVVELREVLLGRPWIEIVSLSRVRPAIGEGAVIHAAKALELAEREGFELAISEARRALASPLPDHAAADLDEKIDLWRRAMGR